MVCHLVEVESDVCESRSYTDILLSNHQPGSPKRHLPCMARHRIDESGLCEKWIVVVRPM